MRQQVYEAFRQPPVSSMQHNAERGARLDIRVFSGGRGDSAGDWRVAGDMRLTLYTAPTAAYRARGAIIAKPCSACDGAYALDATHPDAQRLIYKRRHYALRRSR